MIIQKRKNLALLFVKFDIDFVKFAERIDNRPDFL